MRYNQPHGSNLEEGPIAFIFFLFATLRHRRSIPLDLSRTLLPKGLQKEESKEGKTKKRLQLLYSLRVALRSSQSPPSSSPFSCQPSDTALLPPKERLVRLLAGWDR